MLHHQREEAATEPVAVVSFDDSNWFVAAGLFVEEIVALAEETAVRPHTHTLVVFPFGTCVVRQCL